MQLNSEVAKKFKLYNIVTFDDLKAENKVSNADRYSVSLEDVIPQNVEWLWDQRIALGKLTMISGDPGLGKSMLTSYLAAQVTQGKSYPGELLYGEQTKEKGSVIMLSAEDDVADTLVQRLKAAGADLAKVRAMNPVLQEGKKHRGLDIAKDINILEDIIESFGDCKLITIDPVSSFLGKVDANSNSDVRGALAPIMNLAQKHRIALVCISHLNKGSGKAMYRTIGSLAFTAAARAAFGIAKDEEDEEVRYMCEIKNNLAKNTCPLTYTISYSNEHRAPYLIFGGEVRDKTTEDIMNPEPSNGNTKKELMREVITSFLSSGARTADEVRAELEKHNLSFRSLERYKKEFKVESYRPDPTGAWFWRFT